MDVKKGAGRVSARKYSTLLAPCTAQDLHLYLFITPRSKTTSNSTSILNKKLDRSIFVPNVFEDPSMAIKITAPAPAAPLPTRIAREEDDSPRRTDLEGDIDMLIDSGRSPKRRKRDVKPIITPGEVVTDDPQWMR